jgi:hypothetical protein
MSPHRWGRFVLLPRTLPDGKRAGPIPPVKCVCTGNIDHSALRSGDAFDFCHCGRCIWYSVGFRYCNADGDLVPARVEYETSPEELAWMERQGFTLDAMLDHFATHPVSRPRRAA